MRKEVKNYLINIEYYLNKYKHLGGTVPMDSAESKSYKSNIIWYRKFNTGGKENLKNLQNVLRNHIDEMSFRDFEKIFSGKEQIIMNPINWKKGKNGLHYFLKGLFSHNSIGGNGRINWVAVKNCFQFNGQIINPIKFKGNNKNPVDTEVYDNLLSNL